MPYLLPAEFESRMAALVTPGLCERIEFLRATAEGPPGGPRRYSKLTIGKGGGARTHVLIVAGLHGREWAQPDALLSFVEKLLKVYRSNPARSFRIPGYNDRPGHTYSPSSTTNATVRKIIEKLTLHVVPLANPDGRAFSQAAPPGPDRAWRRNRSAAFGLADRARIGVDLNRNFDIAWNFRTYYSAAFVAAVDPLLGKLLRATDDPADELYQGPSPASEPEVQNLVQLFNDHPITWLLDMHSAIPAIMYPWGIERNQTAMPWMKFQSMLFDSLGGAGGRDGTLGNLYSEYFPNDPPERQLDDHTGVAGPIRDAILAVTGRTYPPQPAVDNYASTGTIRDYAFSRQFTIPGSKPIRAFTIEFGDRVTDGFQPANDPADREATKHGYLKIEREIHAALITFLRAIIDPTLRRP
jgi:hypothetical protein